MTVPNPSPEALVGPCRFVGSWNAAPALRGATQLLATRPVLDLLDAIVHGISLVEDDPEEMSVGYGGLPNEEGEVELDAAVMHGPLHRAGGVAGLRRVRHAARVALEVLRRTDHALLVGEGAARFARQCGFTEEDLVTPAARRAWLDWKASLSAHDAWIGPESGTSTGTYGEARTAGHSGGIPTQAPRVPFTYGTIHVSGLDARGDLYACTSTSGLSYKIPGRVGDSPLPGCGLFTDNEVGAAGATGRGEASMQHCAAFDVVRHMERGLAPDQACLEVLRGIARRTRETRLLDAAHKPRFNLTLYALRRDGEAGAAAMHPGYTYVAGRGAEVEVRPAISLFHNE